jgi:hypothetical protein
MDTLHSQAWKARVGPRQPDHQVNEVKAKMSKMSKLPNMLKVLGV